MKETRRSLAPAVVVVALLLLPLIYVGSYLALVRPEAEWMNLVIDSRSPLERYRFGGKFSETIFWPLEQIDRRVRPGAWDLILPATRL